MTAGIPPPNWPMVNEDGTPSVPWYGYLKAADGTWRVPVTPVQTTVNGLIANSGVTVITTPSTQTLALPQEGCRKVLVVASASTVTKVASISTATNIRPGTGWRLNFTSSAAHKGIELVGLSSLEWFIASNPGSVTVTT